MERHYTEVHQGEDMPSLRRRRFVGALITDCRLRDVRGAVFQDCVLAGTKLETNDVRDMMGVTLSIDCFTFARLGLSATALDAFLYLLSTTEGNDATRAKLRELIDPKRLQVFDRTFEAVE